MQNLKTLAMSRLAIFIGGSVLALSATSPLMGTAQDKAKDSDPHSQHQDKQAPGDRTLASQLAELHAKVAKLEAALEKNQPATSQGMSGMGDKKTEMEGAKMMGGMADKKKGMGGKSGMGLMDMDEMKGTGAVGGDKAGKGGMGMMDQQMMQMMQMMKQMMEMKKMEMTTGKGMGSGMPDMKTMQTPDMKGMEKGTKGMEMGRKGMEMMGKGMAGKQTLSALPGFPGASQIYHVGATGFFLDHSEHVKLTTEQQTALNHAKENGLLEQSSFQRKADAAEQELGTLTSSDQPDATKIDAKVREIEKLRGDQRLAFIRAVGEAAKMLTDDQRRSLLPTEPDKSGAHTAH